MSINRYLAALLSLLLLLSLVACQTAEGTADTSDSESQSESATESEPYTDTEQVPRLEYAKITNFPVDSMHLGPVSCGYACVVLIDQNQDHFAYVNLKGEVLNNARFNYAEDFCNNKALVELQDGTIAYIDTDGDIVIDNDNNSVTKANLTLSLKEDLFGDITIYEDGDELYGLQDIYGNRITDPIFSYIDDFAPGDVCVFATLHQNNQHVPIMLFSNGSTLALPDKTDYAYVEDDRIYCIGIGKNDDLQTILDMTGQELLSKRYSMIKNCQNGYYVVIDEGKLGILEYETCKIVFEPSLLCDWSIDMNIGYGEGYLTVMKDGCLSFVHFIAE